MPKRSATRSPELRSRRSQGEQADAAIAALVNDYPRANVFQLLQRPSDTPDQRVHLIQLLVQRTSDAIAQLPTLSADEAAMLRAALQEAMQLLEREATHHGLCLDALPMSAEAQAAAELAPLAQDGNQDMRP